MTTAKLNIQGGELVITQNGKVQFTGIAIADCIVKNPQSVAVFRRTAAGIERLGELSKPLGAEVYTHFFGDSWKAQAGETPAQEIVVHRKPCSRMARLDIE